MFLRRLPRGDGRGAFGLAPVAHCPPVGAAETPSQDRQRDLAAERVRLEAEFFRLFKAEKLDDAIPIGEKLVSNLRQSLVSKTPGPEGERALRQTQENLESLLSWLVGQHARCGDWATAIRKQRELAEAVEQVYGKDDYRARDARWEIAYRELLQRLKPEDARQLVNADQAEKNFIALYGQGKYREARPLSEEILQVRCRLLEDSDSRIATSLNNLASLYQHQGDYARAEPLFRQASESWKKAAGENHPEYATSLNNLASLYQDQADYCAGRAAVPPGDGNPQEGPRGESPPLCRKP